jgi:hypothetical protein
MQLRSDGLQLRGIPREARDDSQTSGTPMKIIEVQAAHSPSQVRVNPSKLRVNMQRPYNPCCR